VYLNDASRNLVIEEGRLRLVDRDLSAGINLPMLDLRCLRACISAAADLPGWRHANLYPSTLIETPVEQLLRLFPDRAPDQTYCIELSEQQLLGAPSALRDATSSLRRSGVRIAIDDVGFGRTSLEHLVLIEPEVVKIDRKWVAGIGHDRGRLRTLKRLVEVANALGAMVIAEGIEDAEEVAALLDLGVRYGQGFLLGRPSTRPSPLPS
jgi:EAL domain-containing protein (putative c-di-GMP-specific phosphodiesterase class I)